MKIKNWSKLLSELFRVFFLYTKLKQNDYQEKVKQLTEFLTKSFFSLLIFEDIFNSKFLQFLVIKN